MKIRVFTLRLDPKTGRFDDSELQAWLEDHEALSVSEHFLVHEQVPTLLLIVTGRVEQGSESKGRQKTDREPEVAPADRPLYDAIRKWRNRHASEIKRPVFIIMGNQEMADIAHSRPKTVADLLKVRGIGNLKARQYGEPLLALVKAHQPGLPPPETPHAP